MSITEKGIDLLAKRVNDIVDFVIKKAPGFIHSQYKNYELLVEKGLPDYLRAQYHKCDTIRTLIKRDSPTLLKDIYVDRVFSVDNKKFFADEIINKIGIQLDRIIVTGLAGSGKSLFLKNLFRTSIESGHTFYPIYFELRSIKTDSERTLLDEIFHSVEEYAQGFSKSQFYFGLRNGLFYIMIDALDETKIGHRQKISNDICSIARQYPNCPIVVTSRPSEEFVSWEGFSEAHLLPFTYEQCINYITKIDFDSIKKQEFLDELKGGLFQKHQEFLSNPLLAAMMLLTFDEYGDIPEKRHVFFEKCFHVLLREHDSSKGRFHREFHTQLSFSDIEIIFMYFCVFSYVERIFIFSRNELDRYISDAISTAEIEASLDSVVTDLKESVSILQQDGDNFEFAHRSFQEYFYARFCVRDRKIELIDKIRNIPDLSGIDDTVAMIADMDRDYFESGFLLPMCRQLNVRMQDIDPDAEPDNILGLFFSSCALDAHPDSQQDDQYNPAMWYTIPSSDEEESRALHCVAWFEVMQRARSSEDAPARAPTVGISNFLSAFDVTEPGLLPRSEAIEINVVNREILRAVCCNYYAKYIKECCFWAEDKLNRSNEYKKNTLAQRLRAGRSIDS